MCLVFFGIFSGWLLDLFSTSIGLILGFQESSPFFLVFPMGWLLMMSAAAWLIYFVKAAPLKVRALLLVWIVLCSYAPALHNLILIWSVII